MPSPTRSRQDAAQNGEVIRFRPAARKDNLLRPGTDEPCHPLTRLFNRVSGLQTFRMEAGWVAKNIREKGSHGLPNSGVQRCGRVVIEIDQRFTHAMPRSPQVPPLMPLPLAMQRGV